MPKGKRPSLKPKKKVEKISCAACAELKPPSNYYTSYNAIHQTGRIPYCKECLKKMIVLENGNVHIEKLKETLRLIDRPFLYSIWKSSIDEPGDTFGVYIKNIGMLQYRNLGWADSRFLPELTNEINYDTSLNSERENKQNFRITDDIFDKWGYGYSNDEYMYFEKKWHKLIDNYGEKTSLHVEGLKTYIRFRVKEEIATAKGDVKDAKDWASLANSAATAAKINVLQLSKSDISGGVDLLPQLFEAVESGVGIIPILPNLKEQPYDDADLIIWAVINYCRRLEDKPRIEYRDIWMFYDEMLNEYYQQRGLSDDAVQEEKRKRNNVFRNIGDVYKEPIYEESDA